MSDRALISALSAEAASPAPWRNLRPWHLAAALVVLGLAATLSAPGFTQDGAIEPLTEDELEELVGPIALYPDDVLGVVLPAATYPLQIVEAARFLDERDAGSAVTPDDDWDDSVVALLNYPEVVRLLNDDLDWTWALGEAVLDDEAAVLDAVQTFRRRAYLAGNLASDDRQSVVDDEGVITVSSVDPEVVYIPYYEPAEVVTYRPVRVYHYYPYAYPVYYYPYPYGYHFDLGYFWGVTSAFSIGWHTHLLHVHHHSHFGHPYYARAYYTPYYYRSGVYLTVNVNNYYNVWRPSRRRGARPYDGYRATDGGGRVYDGRRYNYREGSRDISRRTTGEPGTRDRTVTGDQRTSPQPRTARATPGRSAGQTSDSQMTRTRQRTAPTQPLARDNPRSNGTTTPERSTQRGARPTPQRDGSATPPARQRTAPSRQPTQRSTSPAPRTRQRTVPSQPSSRTRTTARSPTSRSQGSSQGSSNSSRFAGVQGSSGARQSAPRQPTSRAPSGTARSAAPAPRTRAAPTTRAPRAPSGSARSAPAPRTRSSGSAPSRARQSSSAGRQRSQRAR